MSAYPECKHGHNHPMHRCEQCDLENELDRLREENQRLKEQSAAIAAAREALERASKLVHLLTIRQVVEAGDPAINAAGLNPYAMNEGADPDAAIGAHFISHALALLNGQKP